MRLHVDPSQSVKTQSRSGLFLVFFVCLFLIFVFFPKLALAKEAVLFEFYLGYFFYLPRSIIPI